MEHKLLPQSYSTYPGASDTIFSNKQVYRNIVLPENYSQKRRKAEFK